MSEVLGTEYRRVIRRSDGRFYRAGSDCPDYWVLNPLDASDVGDLMYLKDIYLEQIGGAIVEIEVTARLTGFGESQLYRNGEWVDPREPSPKPEDSE